MLRAIPPLLFFLAATLFLNFSDSAQDKLLTLDDLYDPEKRVNFSENPPPGLIWLDGNNYLLRFWDSSFPEAHTRSDFIYSEGAPKSLDPNS